MGCFYLDDYTVVIKPQDPINCNSRKCIPNTLKGEIHTRTNSCPNTQYITVFHKEKVIVADLKLSLVYSTKMSILNYFINAWLPEFNEYQMHEKRRIRDHLTVRNIAPKGIPDPSKIYKIPLNSSPEIDNQSIVMIDNNRPPMQSYDVIFDRYDRLVPPPIRGDYRGAAPGIF
jgi:hypothetical protein